MLPTNKSIGLLIILMLALGLNACGFKLRGSGALRPEMQRVFIQEEYLESGFGRKLSQALQARGSTIAADQATSTGILDITEPENKRRLLSVNTLAQARDYLLVSMVNLSLKDNEGDVVFPRQKVEVRRELVADPNNVLASDQEAERLFVEMEDELVQAILMRVRGH